MIPAAIAKRHVLSAIRAIETSGVPSRRASTKFAISYNGQTYPPKLVLSAAAKLATGRVLRSEEFSGGKETNGFLRKLGFEVIAANEEGIVVSGSVVATVLLQKDSYRHDLGKRLVTTETIIDGIAEQTTDSVLILFPGGWFKAKQKPPQTIFRKCVEAMTRILKKYRGRIAASFGLDGNHTRKGTLDQTAVFVTNRGAIAGARKFYGTKSEQIRPAPHWDAGEWDLPRIAEFAGRKYFLAVCYDSFGIKRTKPKRPSIDAILDHVHRFDPLESEVLFARHGFAGASQVWRCPVFGAAVFVHRWVPFTWPSAVAWKGPPRSTMKWKYAHNGIRPIEVLEYETDEGLTVVRFFSRPPAPEGPARIIR